MMCVSRYTDSKPASRRAFRLWSERVVDYQAGLGTAFYGDRPNLNAGRTASNVVTGTKDHWIDPTAFTLPPVGELGNMGRNNIIGPRFWDIDFSVLKDTNARDTWCLSALPPARF